VTPAEAGRIVKAIVRITGRGTASSPRDVTVGVIDAAGHSHGLPAGEDPEGLLGHRSRDCELNLPANVEDLEVVVYERGRKRRGTFADVRKALL
jgi:hypothetical protein